LKLYGLSSFGHWIDLFLYIQCLDKDTSGEWNRTVVEEENDWILIASFDVGMTYEFCVVAMTDVFYETRSLTTSVYFGITQSMYYYTIYSYT